MVFKKCSQCSSSHGLFTLSIIDTANQYLHKEEFRNVGILRITRTHQNHPTKDRIRINHVTESETYCIVKSETEINRRISVSVTSVCKENSENRTVLSSLVARGVAALLFGISGLFIMYL